MPAISTTLHSILFADDTTVSSFHQNLNTLQNIINRELSSLNEWFLANKLTLNTSKTSYMLFIPKNKKIPITPKITINNTDINPVTCTKFLGVMIDNKLSWTPQINLLCTKIAKNMSVLFKLRGLVSSKVLRHMY